MQKILINNNDYSQVESIVNNRSFYDEKLVASVKKIVTEVKNKGDKAVLGFAKKFDGVKQNADDLLVTPQELEQAMSVLSTEIKEAIMLAKQNIEYYQSRNKKDSKQVKNENGVVLENYVRAYEKVGVYVPGGSAPLVSTVLMTVLPAKVAGVEEIVVATPPQKDGKINPYILAACEICGVDKVYKVGGAQAVAALAFGTETIPKVDKIVGPGNIFVTLAKKEVYGYVDIDMVAGPSEILVVADENANPEWVAVDLMSQAEHDAMASSFLVCFSEKFADDVAAAFEKTMQTMSRRDIIEKSWKNNAKFFVVEDIDQAVEIVNLIAPEHLELMLEDADSLMPKIKNAGAIFKGYYTPEAIGDYVAGPSHVLPTGGSAKYFSALSAEDFYKNISVISYNKEAFDREAQAASIFANLEGLEAHGKSVEIRM